MRKIAVSFMGEEGKRFFKYFLFPVDGLGRRSRERVFQSRQSERIERKETKTDEEENEENGVVYVEIGWGIGVWEEEDLRMCVMTQTSYFIIFFFFFSAAAISGVFLPWYLFRSRLYI